MRSALAAGVALVVAGAAGPLAPAALADQAVVTATIYPAGQGSVSSQTVTLGRLANCPAYAGAAPFVLQPSGQPYQPAQGSAWALATIVSCGLQIPSSSLTGVQVQSVPHGYEALLSWPDLSDPGQYHDATAAGALPVISLDGGQDQVTYERPLRGPSDANGADGVTESGPVTIAVYENAAPLTVRITSRAVSASPAGVRTAFTASASDPGGGATVPAGLSFRWTFGDGAGSGAAQPAHTFPAGRYFVTVVVTDRAQGRGGTATVPVTVDSSALSAPTTRAGAGSHRPAASPSGAVWGARGAPAPRRPSSPGHRATPPHSGGAPGSRPSSAPATTRPAATPAAARPAPPARATPPPATAPPRPAAAGRHRGPARRSREHAAHPAGATSGPLRIVRGELIADVVPVAAGASRLVRLAPAAVTGAAAVRAATRSTNVAGWLAGLAGLALLGAGAGRELRGRRRSGGAAR